LPLPRYSVVATGGVAHEQVFEVDCAIPKLGLRTLGRGPSRRAAEQAAAAVALEQARIFGRARVSADGAAA
jgi:ribonuclease-3